jgi:hypothetical protein
LAEHFPLKYETVASAHLRHIEERISKDYLQLDDAIFTSVSLRILFENSLLGRVAKTKGITLEIITPNLSNIPFKNSIFFACGGYEFLGRRVSPVYLYREPGLTSIHRTQFERDRDSSPKELLLTNRKLQEFEKSVSISIFGREINRGDLFKFVANKGGGVHTASDQDVAKFEDFQKDLKTASEIYAVNGLNIVCYEVFATAWFLMNSPSVVKLREILGTQEENIILFPRSS